MRKLSIILLALVLAVAFAIPAMAETSLTTPEARPTIDTFKARTLTLDAVGKEVTIQYELGYVSGNFVAVQSASVEISDRGISRNRRFILTPEQFDTLPAAYQASPVTKVLQEINSGSFGGQTTLTAYLEVILQALAGL